MNTMAGALDASKPRSFFEELKLQRWDDHRFYHHSRVNQSLHLFSASCFLVTYALIPLDPVAAAVFGWFIAMWSRQIGHFFFEPKGYDQVNDVSFEYKEDVKVGFNLERKIFLLSAWVAIPVIVWMSPTTFDLQAPYRDFLGYTHRVAVAWWWLAGFGLLARTAWLCATQGVQTGLVWMTKILTDPFHDIYLYHKAPLHLLRGELIDPMTHAKRPAAPPAPASGA